MGRSLLGVFFLTAGLVALASAAGRAARLAPHPAPNDNRSRLLETEPTVVAVTARPLILPAPTFHARFSIN